MRDKIAIDIFFHLNDPKPHVFYGDLAKLKFIYRKLKIKLQDRGKYKVNDLSKLTTCIINNIPVENNCFKKIYPLYIKVVNQIENPHFTSPNRYPILKELSFCSIINKYDSYFSGNSTSVLNLKRHNRIKIISKGNIIVSSEFYKIDVYDDLKLVDTLNKEVYQIHILSNTSILYIRKSNKGRIWNFRHNTIQKMNECPNHILNNNNFIYSVSNNVFQDEKLLFETDGYITALQVLKNGQIIHTQSSQLYIDNEFFESSQGIFEIVVLLPSHIATQSWDQVDIWNLITKERRCFILDEETANCIIKFHNNLLIISFYNQRSVKIYDYITGEKVKYFHR